MRMDAQQQENLLKSATAWQKKPPQAASRAGQDIIHYLERYLDVNKKTGPVVQAFLDIVGDDADHCRPEKFDKGILYVGCSSGPYLHQLRMRQQELIEQINGMCPKAKLRAMRFHVNNIKI